jgi:hypothetical protein
MYWVIQSNIYQEENYEHLLATLERCNIQFSVHKAVPFIGVIEPEPTIPEGMKVIVMGSYSLARHARNRGWTPGAFVDNLDFEIQHRHWGDHMLNADAFVCPFGDIPFQREPFFIRPVLDTKTYTGLVVDWGEYEKWRDGMRRMPEANDPVNDPLSVSVHTLADPTMVCRKKEIYNETRTWVINDSPGYDPKDRGLAGSDTAWSPAPATRSAPSNAIRSLKRSTSASSTTPTLGQESGRPTTPTSWTSPTQQTA